MKPDPITHPYFSIEQSHFDERRIAFDLPGEIVGVLGSRHGGTLELGKTWFSCERE